MYCGCQIGYPSSIGEHRSSNKWAPSFQIPTDNAVLQWLSAQKIKGMLCRWALAIQEYDFKIVYQKGSLNTNADALSCLQTSLCTATVAMPQHSTAELHTAQLRNNTINKVY